MRPLSDRHLAIAMRILLVVVGLGFAAVLVLLNLMRINAELELPKYAHLGMPTYVGVLIGFVPVYVAIAHFWRIAGLLAVSRAISPALLHSIRIIRNCALIVAGWFTAGLLLFFVMFRLVGPPPVVMWGFIEIATLSIAVVASVVLRLLAPRE